MEKKEVNYGVELKRAVAEIWTRCYENKRKVVIKPAWKDLERHHHTRPPGGLH